MACPRLTEFRPRLRNFNGCYLKIAPARDSRPIRRWPFHGATAADELHMHARGVWIFQNSARALPIASASCCRPSYRSGRKPESGCGPVTCGAAFRRMVSLRSASSSAIPQRSRPRQSNWRDNRPAPKQSGHVHRATRLTAKKSRVPHNRRRGQCFWDCLILSNPCPRARVGRAPPRPSSPGSRRPWLRWSA